MKLLLCALPAVMLASAGAASAQDDAAANVVDNAPDTQSQGLFEEQIEKNVANGNIESELEERVLATVLNNFISMDTNNDRLIVEPEWSGWFGWGATPLEFDGTDRNHSQYVTYDELEQTYMETGDERLGKPAHGQTPPGEEIE